jgi:hypothetical protein
VNTSKKYVKFSNLLDGLRAHIGKKKHIYSTELKATKTLHNGIIKFSMILQLSSENSSKPGHICYLLGKIIQHGYTDKVRCFLLVMQI